jgi:hypothetical protein
MVTISSKILGLLLTAALTITPLATIAFAAADHLSASPREQSAAPSETSSGCHAHASAPLTHSPLSHSPLPRSPLSTPIPTPMSYQCCLTGHDVAVVQASQSSRPLTECARLTVRIEPLLAECLVGAFEFTAAVSSDLPDTTQLRI